ERAAAAEALEAIMRRPGARVAPPPSGADCDGQAPDPEGAPREGRTRGGQFARGNRLSKGNAAARRMVAPRAELLQGFDEGRARARGEKLYALAVDGDLEAAKLLLASALGKPRVAPDPDRLDVEEWRLLREAPTLIQLWLWLHERGDPAFA